MPIISKPYTDKGRKEHDRIFKKKVKPKKKNENNRTDKNI